MSTDTMDTTVALPPSVLTCKQVKTFRTDYTENGEPRTLIAEVRHDDECGNGHNSFAITGELYEPHAQRGEPTVKHASGRTLWLNSCGCLHDEIAKRLPELAPFIRWHLSSTDGPMHYAANAKYWAGHSGYRDGKPNSPPNLEYLKSTIAFGALPEDTAFNLADCLYNDARGFTWNENKAHELEQWLHARLSALMLAFKRDVEVLGFTY